MKAGDRMPDNAAKKKLGAIYRTLYRTYGPQHCWPGDTPCEVMVGAVLTQNTAWANVEKAIVNLKREQLLEPGLLFRVPLRKLAVLIRPSGFFNIKARRLKHLFEFITDHYSGSLVTMFADDPETLRQNLLKVNGIGPETADSILLYAGQKPFFVVDAYTNRVLSRHGIIAPDADYHTVQQLFMDSLPRDSRLFNEYHALIVRVGKEHCKKTGPRCTACPLKKILP
jgi:endonuclease-3 related protein